MNFNEFFQSKSMQIALWIIVIIVLMLFSFQVGLFAGFRKADFNCRWGENYHKNFGGPAGGFMSGFNDKDYLDANGTFGKILKIEGQNIIIQGRENVEKDILVNENTVIRSQRADLSLSQLKNDDFIVVIGEPNKEGKIEAKLIRMMPPPGLPPFDNQFVK